MKSFKNTLIAFITLAVMSIAIPILLPYAGFGSNTTGGNAPTNQTQNVLVVNSGQQPVPVTGTASVTGTVQAQQSGTWNVGINGTPSVGIDSQNNTVKIDGTSPIRVRDVDNPARNSFVFSDSSSIGANFHNATFLFSIPANKLLVIEQVSAQCELTPVADQTLSIAIGGQLNDVNTRYYVMGQNTGKTPNNAFDVYVASSQMKIYSDSSNPVNITVHRDDATGIANSVNVYVSGYLIDYP